MNFKQALSIILVIFGFFQSCNGQDEPRKLKDVNVNYELPTADKAYLNRVIDSMYSLDQGKRFDMKRLDTLYGVAEIKYLSRAKVLGDRYGEYKRKRDSLWEITAGVDETNTLRLIAITKKYGFPNNRRLGRYKSKAYLIFVHSPHKYADEIRDLIEGEYEKGRIDEYKKEYIYWDLNGRRGMPPMNGKNGEAVWIKN